MMLPLQAVLAQARGAQPSEIGDEGVAVEWGMHH
jgi:hypothetical protein